MNADPRLIALGVLSGLAIAWPVARLWLACRREALREARLRARRRRDD